MQDQLAIRNVLRRNLLATQSKNPKYSLRSYSKKVGIHSGALSAIMSGKRNISREMAERIVRKLMLDPQERSELLSLFPSVPTPMEDTSSKYLEIEASEFRLIAEWEHFAILSLIKCSDFKNDCSWIAGRLGITTTRARDVVARLLQLGFIKENEKGKLVRVKASIRSSDDSVDLSVRKSHVENLDLARESLQRDDVKDRDFTSITMAIDPDKIMTAKEKIRKFQDDLSNFMSTGELTEVYRMSIQLFPMTQLHSKKSN